MFWYAYLCCLLLTLPIIAPEEISFRDTDSSSKRTKTNKEERERERNQRTKAQKLFEEKPEHENQQVEGATESPKPTRTPFEDSLKIAFDARKKNTRNKNQSSDPLERAKQIFNDIKQSSVPLAEFVKPLRDTFNSNKPLSNVYSGEKYEDARAQMEKDLKAIDPYLYKKFRDSFFDETSYRKKNKNNNIARTDQEYFDYLNEQPEQLLNPHNPHEDTPLEIAINTASPEMAERIIEIAKTHGIRSEQLLAPLIERYKVLHNINPEEAHNYLQSIYNLEIPKLSSAMYREVSKLK